MNHSTESVLSWEETGSRRPNLLKFHLCKLNFVMVSGKTLRIGAGREGSCRIPDAIAVGRDEGPERGAKERVR